MKKDFRSYLKHKPKEEKKIILYPFKKNWDVPKEADFNLFN